MGLAAGVFDSAAAVLVCSVYCESADRPPLLRFIGPGTPRGAPCPSGAEEREDCSTAVTICKAHCNKTEAQSLSGVEAVEESPRGVVRPRVREKAAGTVKSGDMSPTCNTGAFAGNIVMRLLTCRQSPGNCCQQLGLARAFRRLSN
jgi:hypothetical protein